MRSFIINKQLQYFDKLNRIKINVHNKNGDNYEKQILMERYS